MRIAHVPFTYAPDPMGGTEVYVSNLVTQLRPRGIEGFVGAPGQKNESYELDAVAVHRFGVSRSMALEELYGEGDAIAAGNFGKILDADRPDLVHFHALTSATSIRTMREALRRNLPVVFTYHTPTVTCQRGTLLEFGRTVCDGIMERVRCTGCSLHGKGLPPIAARFAARLPRMLGDAAARMGMSGGPWTALRMERLVDIRQSAVREFLGNCSRIVVPARWVAEVLSRNGLAAGKLVFCRQGVGKYSPAHRQASRPAGGPLRIAWLGRLHPTKGLHVLVDALAQAPALNLLVDAYTVAQPGGTDRYGAELTIRVAKDGRIRLLPAIPAARVVETLRGYDVLAVPSQCLETGPLVVLEAFAAGIPVIGSGLGGIAELVEDGETGFLVAADSAAAWVDALARLEANQSVLARLAANLRPPRTMDEVAIEMHTLYSEVLATNRPQ